MKCEICHKTIEVGSGISSGNVYAVHTECLERARTDLEIADIVESMRGLR